MIPAWASDFTEIQFVAHGRDRAGADCYGLVCIFYAERMGKKLPQHLDDYDGTNDDTAANAIQRERISGNWRRLDLSNGDVPHLGDLCMFRAGHHMTHMGVMLDATEFLHSVEGIGSCIETLNSRAWITRLAGFYRHAH